MKIDKANKIVAAYMGYRVGPAFSGYQSPPCKAIISRCGGFNECQYAISPLYSESLDALVPVWEKIKPDYNHYGHLVWLKERIYEFTYSMEDYTFQEAACIATAEGIQALEDEK